MTMIMSSSSVYIASHILSLYQVMLMRVIRRILIKLLKESTDPIVLAVAVHDVGQYVKHYERGKKCVFVSLSSLQVHHCS